MDTKKLDKWADLLLDTGKRNNLINFRDTKASTVEVLHPSADELFGKIESAATFEVFDPKLIDDADEEESISADEMSEEKAEGKKESYLALYSPKMKKQSQILLYSNGVNPITAIKNIDKKAKDFIEETGVNVAYMAFGFIHWKESDSSNIVFRAPILLVPIQMEQESAIAPYYIKTAGDDIIVNPTFAYKLNEEHGVSLPEYNDEGLSAYLSNVEKIVKKLHWSVSDECKAGIFSFLKINMYSDLKNNAEAILDNQNVRRLLGEPAKPRLFGFGADENSGIKVTNPLIELHNVVDADSSQIEAIEMAKSGKSFVLQGPPGTGKSQTITNIIAECLSDGKKVLFVSEKLAALNVVYDKLKQAGLSEFCLELHSHKANKKDVIAELCRTLRANKSNLSSKADGEIEIKEKAQHQLDAYAEQLHKQQPVIEKSLYQLYENYSSLRAVPDMEWVVPQLALKGDDWLRESSSLLGQYVDYIPSIGYDYRKNPWYGYINQETSYQTKSTVKSDLAVVVDFLELLNLINQDVFSQYGIVCQSIEQAHSLRDFFQFIATSRLITSQLIERKNLETVDSKLKELQTESCEISSCQKELNAILDDDIYNLDGEKYYQTLTERFSGFFSRLFNAEYKKIISDLRRCKKDGKNPSYAEAVELTKQLANYQKKVMAFAEDEAPIKGCLGPAYLGLSTDWEYVKSQIDTLRTLLSQNNAFEKLANLSDYDAEKKAFADFVSRYDTCFAMCSNEVLDFISNSFDHAIFDINHTICTFSLVKCKACLNDIDKLDNWCHFRSLLSRLDEQQMVPFIDTAIHYNLEAKFFVSAFQKQFYFQWIDTILSGSQVLSSFNRVSQDRAIRTFAEKDTEQFEINKAKIRAKLSADRPALDMISSGSSLSVLLREGEKKRKQKSIRSLLEEAGELIQRIKPCFLMSPLSVSTFLSSNSVHFDVVVFDEASQIFPQDAIGAIYRAKQLIVVGDSKQMPPSNFFNATIENEDTDEDTDDVTDFESILDLCSTSMPQLRLRWHYRSRYEQLIAFSNKNYYDGDLVTFPSSKADSQGVGVDYYHVDDVFDRRSHTNRKEAEFVVDLIYQNIEKYPNRSLGVVAFSVAQQDLIDKLLQKRRQSTPEKEFFFKGDAKEPFFIKNLETVQGDERDTILFSIAYGFDSQGRFLHNFGPLNRAGGERRLNVAVTRAKYNVQVVSSMHYTDIDLKRTSAEGARLLREYLDYAENGNIALERAVSVNSYEQFDSDFEMEVCDFLRSKGFSVDTQVGCSGFRIDLGLKRENSSDYVLAIECDGATYHSSKNARDRDRLRQEILERMGWKFYRIWSTDWFRNKSVEQLRLLNAASEAVRPSFKPDNESSALKEPPTVESFEETVEKQPFEFPRYQVSTADKPRRRDCHRNFKALVESILKTEAPLSEELLLKRLLWYFKHGKTTPERVTKVIQQEYEEKMRGCEQYGIIRRNGFLYLEGQKKYQFRVAGDITRELKQIAPEELAAGMLEIIRLNVTVDKNGLYHSLALQCGIGRVTKAVNDYFDKAFEIIGSQIEINGEQISLRPLPDGKTQSGDFSFWDVFENAVSSVLKSEPSKTQTDSTNKVDVTFAATQSGTDIAIPKASAAKSAPEKKTSQFSTPKKKAENDEIIKLIKENHIRYVDKRSQGGALWIIGGHELDDFVDKAKRKGAYFKLKLDGGTATRGETAWWVT